MAKRKYCFDNAGIEKLQSEGRGQGSGSDYIPWIRAHDINSIGLTTRAPGWKSGRIHHFLSKLEAHYFYCLEWADCVLDVREQFPLDYNATLKIAEDAGINYPWDRKTGFNTVLTTDFLINVRESKGGSIQLARTVKYSKDLQSERVLEKFEIERRYWQELGVNWGVVTEYQVPSILVSNIMDCYEHRTLDQAINFDVQDVELIASQIPSIAAEHLEYKLNRLSALFDELYSLEAGSTLAVLKHLVATKKIALPPDIHWFAQARAKDINCPVARVRQVAEVIG